MLNWSNSAGTTHVASDGTKTAVFSATAGTVTVDASSGPVSAKGLKFLTSGYSITGDTLTLASSSGAPQVDVEGASAIATISSAVAGSDGLEKIGAGTLVLSGVNTYTGGTTVLGRHAAARRRDGRGVGRWRYRRQCGAGVRQSDGADLWRRGVRFRHADEAGCRHSDADGEQHLHRHDHDFRGHAATRQRRQYGLGGGRYRRQRRARAEHLRNRQQRARLERRDFGQRHDREAGLGAGYVQQQREHYTGATTVSEGTLEIINTGGLGSTAAGTTVASGATLLISGSGTVAEPLTISGAGDTANAGSGIYGAVFGGSADLSGAITLADDATIDVQSVSGTVTGDGKTLTVMGSRSSPARR